MDLDLELPALRRLAGALVHGADADDLVQDTLAAALRHGPRDDRPLRPWLHTVLRNGWRSRHRARSRELARQAAVPAPPGDPSLEHVQLLRELIDELARLPADDRRLLQLRFWEGRSTPECASVLGRPPSTIRTQLSRIVARLRARLDRTGGGRAAWMPVLAPLVPRPGGRAASAVMASKPLAAGGVLAAAVLWLGAAMPHGCGARVEEAPEPTPPGALPKDGEDVRATSLPAAVAVEPRRGAPGPAPALVSPGPSDDDDDVPPYGTLQIGPTGGEHPLLALSMGCANGGIARRRATSAPARRRLGWCCTCASTPTARPASSASTPPRSTASTPTSSIASRRRCSPAKARCTGSTTPCSGSDPTSRWR
ncbi:MAG: sigma-70 family RNA polymerase sigma factor [Deltaproteobacteria bacterium]|nr:sigma-70 family RNA polymerase sigma factor [Deltaproteobacteria bacterium]